MSGLAAHDGREETPATPIRVACYLNQFFAGIGGEEAAGVGPGCRDGAAGAALGLQRCLGNAGQVVGTVYCGDDYLAAQPATAVAAVTRLLARYAPDVVVAGPAFGSGRYGLACGQVCAAVQEQLGVPAVTAMHPDNPAVESFRGRVVVVPTQSTAAGMPLALPALARLALKLGRGEPLDPPGAEGYLPSGCRRNERADAPGAARAVDMLLRKLRGEPFATELPLPRYDRVPPLPPLSTTDGLRVALVAEGGVVPRGNPDRLPSAWATRWARYDLAGVDDLTADAFETVHGGFNTSAANRDPDRLIPVDALRALEAQGRLTLHPRLYSTVGNQGSVAVMRRLGAEIAADLAAAGVEAVVVGAT